MFTGLVEKIGTVRSMVSRQGVTSITIESDLPTREMELGESVAVNGVCLTVTALEGRNFSADAVQETLTRTALSALGTGSRVNLERALRLGDRLGGHLVQGHVDDASRVIDISRRGGDCRYRIELEPALSRYIAEKGSVTLQGVSLTVSAVSREWFEVALIPATLETTTLGQLKRGDQVNVEVDLIARYLEMLMGVRNGQADAGRNWYGTLPTMTRKVKR